MYFKSFFEENLAQYSYLIGCQKTGEALVLDPGRHVNQYMETAKKEGFSITAITETHIHADYLSGSIELAKQSGGKMYLSDEGGSDWSYQFADRYGAELLKDGSTIRVGNIRLDVFHTPGHTPESISFVLTDEGGGSSVPMGIFTGDFVFVGDVGRPDLLEKAANIAGTADSGARAMFQSVKKVMELAEYLQVWPAHGAGSACGKSLGAVPLTTIGYEKENNWAFNKTDEEEFVKELLTDQPEAPRYFGMMKKLNKEGPALLPTEAPRLIKTAIELEDEMRDEKVIVIDTRPASEFANHHIPGTYNIPYNKSFTNWAGWIVPYDQEMILIANDEYQCDIIQALQSIGLDSVRATAPSSFAEKGSGAIHQLTVEEFVQLAKPYQHVDVRNDIEWKAGHINGADHIMLGTLKGRLAEISKDEQVVVQCQSGVRSAIAASILKANGFSAVYNLQGGYAAFIKKYESVSLKV